MTALITIDGMDIPDLRLENRYNYSPVRAVVAQALAGNPIIFEDAAGYAGRPCDLTGTDGSGWITRQELENLIALAAVPNASYTMIYSGETMTVRFRNEDQPVIEAEPVLPVTDDDDTDWFNNVRVKFMRLD